MKKLLIFPLLVGVFSACFAFSATHVMPTLVILQNGESQPALEEIFQAAIPLFMEQYGVETSLSGLQNGYENGSVTITEYGQHEFIVSLDGNDIIACLEDYF